MLELCLHMRVTYTPSLHCCSNKVYRRSSLIIAMTALLQLNGTVGQPITFTRIESFVAVACIHKYRLYMSLKKTAESSRLPLVTNTSPSNQLFTPFSNPNLSYMYKHVHLPSVARLMYCVWRLLARLVSQESKRVKPSISRPDPTLCVSSFE